MFKNLSVTRNIVFSTCFIATSIVFSWFPQNSFADTENSTHFERALSAYNSGDLESSYIFLKNSPQQQPRNLPAKILIGKVLLESGYTLESEMELSGNDR